MWQVQLNGETYHLQGKIGEGYTAEVFKAVSRQKKTVCVKVINDSFYKQTMGKNLIENQIDILSKLSHPYLLSFLKKEHKSKLMIVTEYCEGGTLYDMLKVKGKIDQGETINIMKQLIEGCRYMHNQGYIHRDLKPQNIFLSEKNRTNIKIADFGFAVNLKDNKLMSANVGSPLYMPYEALTDMKFSVYSDIFALGVIWFELLTGKTPFSASSESQLKELTKRQQFRKMELSCNPRIKELIFKCLKFRPNQRPSLSDILKEIEEGAVSFKNKSKSVCISVKEPIKVKLKDSKAVKENKDPLLSHPGVCRNERCKTNLEKLKPQSVKPFIDKSTQPLKVIQIQTIKQPLGSSKASTSVLTVQNLKRVIQNLSLTKLSFLPLSVQQKFIILLSLYEYLLTGKKPPSIEGSQAKQDELITSLSKCKSEQDFCRTSSGFLRRLLRLAKTYSTNIDQLSKLWNHVQARQ